MHGLVKKPRFITHSCFNQPWGMNRTHEWSVNLTTHDRAAGPHSQHLFQVQGLRSQATLSSCQQLPATELMLLSVLLLLLQPGR
jgi:hypothetical protein